MIKMRSFYTEAKRTFGSAAFVVAALGLLLIFYFGGRSFWKTRMPQEIAPLFEPLSRQLSEAAFHSRALFMLLPFLASLPAASVFVDDCRSRFFRAYLPRFGSRAAYLRGKIAALLGTAFILALLSGLGQILLFHCLFPFSGTAGNYALPPMLLFQSLVLFALSLCFWALLGSLSAVLTMNRYLGYAVPLIVCYVQSELAQRYFRAWPLLNPVEWLSPNKIEFSTAVFLLLGLIFCGTAGLYFCMRRRLLRGC